MSKDEAIKAAADRVDALMGEVSAALGRLTVHVVERWAAEGVPHRRHLRHGEAYYGTYAFCQPPAGYHAWKAVAVGPKADVDAYIAVKARLDAATSELLSAARAA